GDPFGSVTFTGTNGYWTLQGSMTVTSDINLNAGTLDTKSGGNFPIDLGGDWNNGGGHFTVNQSTVTFNGPGSQTINNAGQAFAILIDSNTSSGGVTF